MAFLRSSGVATLASVLEGARYNGLRLEFIVGLDNRMTTADGLRLLMQCFPHATICGFHAANFEIVFHPKVILLDTDRILAAYVGSANLTRGGLMSNFEAGVWLELQKNQRQDMRSIAELEQLWNFYRNPADRYAGLLALITEDWIRAHLQDLGPEPQQLDRGFEVDKPYGVAGFPRLPTPRVPRMAGPRHPRRRIVENRVLYLEILRETGGGGTQVQIPTETLREYFRSPLTENRTILVSFHRSPFRPATICHFPNNTHRISLPELTGIERPCMVLFVRSQDDPVRYHCRILAGERYRRALRRCDSQTRLGAKHWGLH